MQLQEVKTVNTALNHQQSVTIRTQVHPHQLLPPQYTLHNPPSCGQLSYNWTCVYPFRLTAAAVSAVIVQWRSIRHLHSPRPVTVNYPPVGTQHDAAHEHAMFEEQNSSRGFNQQDTCVPNTAHYAATHLHVGCRTASLCSRWTYPLHTVLGHEDYPDRIHQCNLSHANPKTYLDSLLLLRLHSGPRHLRRRLRSRAAACRGLRLACGACGSLPGLQRAECLPPGVLS